MEDKDATRILVVDDDELLREFYARVLRTHGYVSICAINGEEAVSLLETNGDSIALAIIDLLMPEMTGWELIDTMKKNPEWANIPILTITGLATSFDEFERVKEVSDAVLHKGDFELSTFNETVEKLLGKNAS